MGKLAQLATRSALSGADCATLATAIVKASGLSVYEPSLCASGGYIYGLVRERSGGRRALVCWPPEQPAPPASVEQLYDLGDLRLVSGPADFANASAFMKALPFLKPVRLGTQTACGMGDRLGLATPGHVRAARDYPSVRPVFAQQSIREMMRAGRSAREVVADAVFGALQEGWRDGFGADADHLKTPEDVENCHAAGFTMFTVDPGEHVQSAADSMSAPELSDKVAALPWETLEATLADTLARYGKPLRLPGDLPVRPEAADIVRAAVKYGAAVAHVLQMYRRLCQLAGDAFELEISVDETAAPTTTFEHYYVASELRRLQVRWVSLAPRFVGRFEKGVDYIGDLAVFRECLRGHVAVMRELGPYKLSIHSGSDKFSVYPVVVEEAGGLVHLKTAGTSYLAALTALAQVEPEFVRSIYRFAVERYPQDRATYHVSADMARLARPENVAATALPALISEFNARQVFHVTFGSVLTAKRADGGYMFRDDLYRLLRAHEAEHLEELRRHLGRHLAPLQGQG